MALFLALKADRQSGSVGGEDRRPHPRMVVVLAGLGVVDLERKGFEGDRDWCQANSRGQREGILRLNYLWETQIIS